MTSRTPAPVPLTPITSQAPELLRLKLSDSPGRATLDGAWWPRSRDLDVELADLVDHFPVSLGRVDRVVYSAPDWDSRPRSVPTARGSVRTGSFPGDDTRMVVLRMSTRTDLNLLVVPPRHPAGEQAMQVAADPANRWSAAQILAAGPFDEMDDQGGGHWTDDGDTWWRRPDTGPPSYR